MTAAVDVFLQTRWLLARCEQTAKRSPVAAVGQASPRSNDTGGVELPFFCVPPLASACSDATWLQKRGSTQAC